MKLKEIEFLLNLDIMGSGEEGITVVNGRQLTEEFKTLTDINDKNEYLSKVKPRGETANSDHYFFYKNGVPCFFIYTMGPNKHYHDVYDTYEELSFAAYDDIVMLLIDFVGEF
jgi:Zn-dependent M28 family amino/carboxypeptidase